MGHHEWTLTVNENGKFLPNLSLNNDIEIIKNKIENFSEKRIGCHKYSYSISNYNLSIQAVSIKTNKHSLLTS